MKVILSLIFISLFLGSCTAVYIPIENSGEIKMEVATRGSYQYLIQMDEALFWPENLPEQYKVPGLKVKVKYKEKGIVKDIFKPAPNDVTVLNYTVPVITILDIKKKDDPE